MMLSRKEELENAVKNVVELEKQKKYKEMEVIETFTQDEILNKWKNTDLSTREKTCVYVSNPFCAQKCKFCHYSSYLVTPEEYSKYYTEFLPNQIKNFREVLISANPDYMYFGGGTSSVMTPKILSNILGLFPRCRDMKFKSFEAHPVSLTKEKIDILADYKFNYLSLGVQTFDKEELEKQNRLSTPFDRLADLVQYAQSKGMSVNFDLMAFLDADVEKDINRLVNDIKISLGQLNADFLDIYPKTEEILNCKYKLEGKLYSESECKAELDKSVKLHRAVLKTARLFKDSHILIKGDRNLSDLDSMLTYIAWNYRIVRNTLTTTKGYDCTSRPNIPNNQNVIAFGGYKQHCAYSYMGKDFYYETSNEDNIISNVKYVQYPIK